MAVRRAGMLIVITAMALVSGSCATLKSIGNNVQRIVDGKQIDQNDLRRAVASDSRDMEVGLRRLRRQFEKAVASLKANVRRSWGRYETRVSNRTVYVKYTQGYKSRVVTDFDHGLLTVETLDDKDPEGSLKKAVIAALLTSSDPASVDLFSDKDVRLEAGRTPYLYGLVLDEDGKPIRTREQAARFAAYLVPARVATRSVQADTGRKTARYVRLAMVKNYETVGVERYRDAVAKYAAQYQVSPSLVFAIIRTESNFNPFAVSGVPAYGLMQLVPSSGGRAAYRRAKGVNQEPSPDYLLDPEHNIELGVAYLSVLNKDEFDDVSNPASRDYCVIAAYNTGPANVTRTFSRNRGKAIRSINELTPPALYDRLRSSLPYEETRRYIVKVTSNRRAYVDVLASP